MNNDKYLIKDNELEKVTGGKEERTVLGSTTNDIYGKSVTLHNMPKINSDEKYIMADAVPTAAEIISELKS